VLSNFERCQRKAAECDELARRVRDPAARIIFQRAAGRWRRMADESDDRLPPLMRALAPDIARDDERAETATSSPYAAIGLIRRFTGG
jgi:hypothetical protein